MTYYTTLVQRCRRTNSMLADELEAEFRRLTVERDILSGKLDVAREGLKDIAGRAHSRLANSETNT